MKRTWAIIGVADVARSFKWYQSLFGQPESVPAHDYFGQVLDTDGTVLLCQSTRGGAPDESRHRDPRVRSPRSGRLLRHGQRARLNEA
jgi:hypothetical protein